MSKRNNSARSGRPKLQSLRVIVADDHALLRNYVVQMLEGRGIEVVGQAATGDAAVLLAKDRLPDVVIMDVRMPGGMDGISATRQVCDSVPGCRVVAFSMDRDQATVARMRKAGAVAYVCKGDPLEVLLEAVLSHHVRGQRAGDDAGRPRTAAKGRGACPRCRLA